MAVAKVNQNEALLLELSPVVVYVVAYAAASWVSLFDSAPIMVATACFIVATVVAVTISIMRSRTLPVMPLATALPLCVLGGIGLAMKDDTFIKLRPTVINVLFSIILLGGLFFNKALLRYVFGVAFKLSVAGWRKLTFRWGLFCLVMAILNELIWRTMSDGIWVVYDAWVSTGLTLAFAIAQYPLLARYEDS